MKPIGWYLITILTIIPLVIWSTMMPLSFRYASLGTIATSIGQILGIVGMVWFSIAMILSARFKVYDSLFGGLNRAYIVHHQVGGIAFLLLMVHPISLAVTRMMISMKSAALFLLPGQDWVINFGIAGLLSLMGLLIFTYYIDLPYELWRFTHKFMGIAFIFGAIHTYFVPSDVTYSMSLRIYLFVIVGAGLISYLYRTILGRWLVPRMPYTVYEVNNKGEGITEIIMVPATEKTMMFSPGQFMFIQFQLPGKLHETHPFSISSAPTPRGFEITAKALGDFSTDLSTIPAGTRALVEGPFGRFSTVYKPSQSYLWIAGGIGITPFMSMARSLQNNTSAIDLYYVVRSEHETIFLQELLLISQRTPLLRVIPWYTKQYGHLTGDLILRNTPDVKTREIFLCGPPAMMKGTKKELSRIGVKRSKMHSEEFSMS